VAAFFERASWLVGPPDRAAIERLDPVRDRDRIFHFVARDFRSELKIFAVLHEMRAAVSLPLASFFLGTREFSERGVTRIVDTVLLVCNVLEWGQDSARGRYCLERINRIHARYAIPNAAFKFVLCGILFVPWEWNRRFGWRPLSDTERLGWFHAFVELGRAMGIDELDDDFDATYRWYRDVSDAAARFAPNKQRLVHDILGQVLARYPKAVRAVIAAAFLAGMDDAYLTAAALPRVPETTVRGLQGMFRVAGEHAAGADRQSGPWLQSLLTSSVYPEGYELEQLGVARRSVHLPAQASPLLVMTRAELAQRVARGELLVVIDGGVYDLGSFAALHPGGRAVFERQAGRDASLAFGSAPHSAGTWQFRENYRVATLEGEAPHAPASDPVPSQHVLGAPRSRTVPSPERADCIEQLVPSVLGLVNRVASDALTDSEVQQQLRAMCVD
jgi:cytochrome b involved in lipid metabolism